MRGLLRKGKANVTNRSITGSIGSGKGRAGIKIVSCLALAFALGIILCAAATSFAQNDTEAPKGLPETTIAPAAGSGSSAPAASPSGAESAPATSLPATTGAPAAKPIKHKTHVTSHKATAYKGEVESGSGMLKLTENGWAYATPSKASSHVQAVHAGKFVNVTGTTAHYVRVKLKSGATAYVPMTAVELAKPTDKVFRLTKDTPVLSVPNQHGKKLAEVHATHDVQVIGISVNYMKIRMKDGLEGFIAINALE